MKEFSLQALASPPRLFLLGVTSKNRFLLSFCKLSYDLEILLGVLAVAKIERTVFVFGHTCKSSPYELLLVRRVLFLLAVTLKCKIEDFRSL